MLWKERNLNHSNLNFWVFIFWFSWFHPRLNWGISKNICNLLHLHILFHLKWPYLLLLLNIWLNWLPTNLLHLLIIIIHFLHCFLQPIAITAIIIIYHLFLHPFYYFLPLIIPLLLSLLSLWISWRDTNIYLLMFYKTMFKGPIYSILQFWFSPLLPPFLFTIWGPLLLPETVELLILFFHLFSFSFYQQPLPTLSVLFQSTTADGSFRQSLPGP